MLIVSIASLFMFILVVINWKLKKMLFTPSSFILIAYLVSIIAGVWVVDMTQIDITVAGTAYYCTVLFIVLQPFILFKESILQSVIRIPKQNIRPISIAIGMAGVLATLYFLQYSLIGFGENIDELRTLITKGEGFLQTSIFTTTAILVAYHYPIMITLAFYNLTAFKSVRMALILFAGSTAYPTYVVCNLGRDGFVFWIGAFVLNYLLFSCRLGKNAKIASACAAVAIAAVLGVVFYKVTVARFDRGEGTVMSSLVSYSGQSIVNFNRLYDLNIVPSRGTINFPLLSRLSEEVSAHGYNLLELRSSYMTQDNFDPNVFTGFVGSFLFDFGKEGLVFYAILFNLILNIVIKLATKQTIATVVLYMAMSNCLLQGIFYFTLSNVIANAYIISVAIICIFIHFMCPDYVGKKSGYGKNGGLIENENAV